MIKKLSSILCISIAMASCAKQEAKLSLPETRADSTAIQVAVMPTLSCLPIYYCEATGLFDSLQIHVNLQTYNSVKDMDTAVINHHADLAFSDLFSAIRLTQPTQGKYYPVFATKEPISLIAIKGKRIRQAYQMKEKMIAISRLSITDYMCDKMMEKENIKADLIYKPQINDVILRASMISSGLLEGAMLPEPFVSHLQSTNHQALFSSGKYKDFPAISVCLAGPELSEAKDTLKTFMHVYRLACQRINKKENNKIILKILTDHYQMDLYGNDSIKFPPIDLPIQLSPQHMEEATKWLDQRESLPKQFDKDLFLSKCGPHS